MFLRFFSVLIIFWFFVKPAFSSRINIFLNIINPISRNILIRIDDISVLINNHYYSLDKSSHLISSRSPFGQTFLGFKNLKSGKITKIVFNLSDAQIGYHSAFLINKNIEIPINYTLLARESVSFFIYWDVEKSIKGNKINPDFYLKIQSRPLRGENLYITCDDASTVFVVRADTNQVQSSVYVPPQPKSLCVDDTSDKLFVLSENDHSINAIELSTFRLVDKFVLPLVASPRYLAMISSGLVVVTDPVTSYVLLFDLNSGNLLTSKKLGYSPSELFYGNSLHRIFISSPVDQNIYLLNTDLDLISKIKAGQRPRGLRLVGDKLYVADYATGMVDVFQAGSWNSVGRIRSGRGAIQVFDLNDRIYISNRREGTVSLLSLGQLSVSRKIHVGKEPYNMAACSRRGWLYVALRGEDAIAVIDMTSEKLVGKISLGCRPFGLIIAK